ncbi:LysM domain-containing protein [Kribbella sp. NPDC051936]|uniref:LysM peptidoglycan-binding domain-containing protein n=1 Tax=Kribbella sp. NPDC051936 TaxID=3154946 RepID=UPI003418CFC5
MSTAAVAADVPAPRRSQQASPRPLRVVPPPISHPTAPTTTGHSTSTATGRSTSAPTGRRLAEPVARSASPAAVPPPVVAPRRRPRIEGASTDRLPVRGCSGESLGREVHPEPALRLTRRGRMLLTAVSVLVFGAAILVLGLRIAGVLEPGPHFTHTVPVQVAPGQTLWSIAEDTNPTVDPVAVVEKIADLNKLATPADILPGQTLQIPVAG